MGQDILETISHVLRRIPIISLTQSEQVSRTSVTSTGSPIVTDQTANTVESVQRRSKVENSSSVSREAVVTSRLESRSLVREESRTLVQPSPQPAPQLTQPTSRHSSASARNGTVPVDQVRF